MTCAQLGIHRHVLGREPPVEPCNFPFGLLRARLAEPVEVDLVDPDEVELAGLGKRRVGELVERGQNRVLEFRVGSRVRRSPVGRVLRGSHGRGRAERGSRAARFGLGQSLVPPGLRVLKLQRHPRSRTARNGRRDRGRARRSRPREGPGARGKLRAFGGSHGPRTRRHSPWRAMWIRRRHTRPGRGPKSSYVRRSRSKASPSDGRTTRSVRGRGVPERIPRRRRVGRAFGGEGGGRKACSSSRRCLHRVLILGRELRPVAEGYTCPASRVRCRRGAGGCRGSRWATCPTPSVAGLRAR